MTSNHLLLCRLAELMLEHEQHILPVDLLFDDAQIGDFAKSIQIDSPYQQLLLEGVLTESVREEMLYISFTVEGYFHYVLGEIIFKQTDGKEPDLLIQILKNNRLNGAKAGVEQCLIRDVQKDDMTKLIWLVDQDESFINVFVNPVFVAFKSRFLLLAKSNKQKVNRSFKKILSNLLSQQTEMDFKLIFEVISLADKQNLISLANQITSCLVKLIKIDSSIKAELISKSLKFLHEYPLRLKMVKELENWQKKAKVQGIIKLEIYSGIAKTYEVINYINEAEFYYRKCLKIENENYDENHLFTSTSYNQIGLLKLQKGQFNLGLKYFKKSLRIKTKTLNESSSEITTALHNIALAYLHLEKYEKCIKQYQIVLTRRLKNEGKNSLDTNLALSNLGIAYAQSMINLEKAEQLLKESIDINIKILGSPNIKNASIFRWLAFVEWQNPHCDNSKVNDLLKIALKDNMILLGKNDLSTAYCHYDLFEFYLHTKELVKANKHGNKALIIYKKILGNNDTRCIDLANKLEMKISNL
jgi:tetratricopeptide (TPR) repeat protein